MKGFLQLLHGLLAIAVFFGVFDIITNEMKHWFGDLGSGEQLLAGAGGLYAAVLFYFGFKYLFGDNERSE